MGSKREQAIELIAQQLPPLEQLKALFASADCLIAKDEGRSVAYPSCTGHELDSYQKELWDKISELSTTPYSTELNLLLLPVLIEIKSRYLD